MVIRIPSRNRDFNDVARDCPIESFESSIYSRVQGECFFSSEDKDTVVYPSRHLWNFFENVREREKAETIAFLRQCVS